jgi:hypothetical protein
MVDFGMECSKVCESCHKTKPRNQFSRKQFKKLHGQCVKCINTKICSTPPVDLPPLRVPQNIGQTLPPQIFTVDVKSYILQLQQENDLLKLELRKCRQESEQKSMQISKYADMVPQLHSKIERLHKENDDLRSEISQLKSQVKILEQQMDADEILLQRYGDQIQILILAKERERQLAIRRLMDYIKANENLKNQLSEGVKKFISDKSTKNKVDSAPHSLSQDLIQEAIRSENKLQFKSIFIRAGGRLPKRQSALEAKSESATGPAAGIRCRRKCRSRRVSTGYLKERIRVWKALEDLILEDLSSQIK